MKTMKFFSTIAAISLMATPAQANMGTKAPNLLMEKLYYAEGRQHPDTSNKNKLSILIPCYDEAATIHLILNKVIGVWWQPRHSMV